MWAKFTYFIGTEIYNTWFFLVQSNSKPEKQEFQKKGFQKE